MTGDPITDFVLDAGPRVFGPDLPLHVREEIAKSPTLGWYRRALLIMKQEAVAQMHASIARTAEENRLIENTQEFKACDGIGYPKMRIPVDVWYQMEDIWGVGCWKDDDFQEDFLKQHPELRLKITRGTKGQQYVEGRQSAATPAPTSDLRPLTSGAKP